MPQYYTPDFQDKYELERRRATIGKAEIGQTNYKKRYGTNSLHNNLACNPDDLVMHLEILGGQGAFIYFSPEDTKRIFNDFKVKMPQDLNESKLTALLQFDGVVGINTD